MVLKVAAVQTQVDVSGADAINSDANSSGPTQTISGTRLQSLADDVMRGDAFDIGDEADAATVLLVCGIIEALLRG